MKHRKGFITKHQLRFEKQIIENILKSVLDVYDIKLNKQKRQSEDSFDDFNAILIERDDKRQVVMYKGKEII